MPRAKTWRPRAVVVGAGPVGCLAAHLLAVRGFAVDLYEKRPHFDLGMTEEGRTINLSVSPRGLAGLRLVGLAPDFLARSIPMGHRILHRGDGRVETTRYGAAESAEWQCHSIGRNDLNRLLFDSARERGARFHFDTRWVEVDFVRKTIRTTDAAGTSDVHYDLLLGADGAFSTVRKQLAAHEAVAATTATLELAYAELNLRDDGGRFVFEPSAIHIWPRAGYFMIGLPNLDLSFKCTLVVPHEGTNSVSSLRSGGFDDLLRTSFPDAYEFLDRAGETALTSPAGKITAVTCDPLHHADGVLLVGDAAHAIAPFLGQGINLGFEDCVVLDDLLARHGTDLAAVCSAYTAERRPNVDAAAALSMANYRELARSDSDRDVGEVGEVGEVGADIVRDADPLVVMVNFLGLPYAEVERRLMS